jgi:branched-subunit amino acid ABC-type transport system permease component
MVYGVLGLINLLTSDVYMFGAFMGYYIATARSFSSKLGTSHIRSGCRDDSSRWRCRPSLGMIIERFAYRPCTHYNAIHLCFLAGNTRSDIWQSHAEIRPGMGCAL